MNACRTAWKENEHTSPDPIQVLSGYPLIVVALADAAADDVVRAMVGLARRCASVGSRWLTSCGRRAPGEGELSTRASPPHTSYVEVASSWDRANDA